MRFAAVLASTLLLTTAACAVNTDLDEAGSAQSDLVSGGDYSGCSLTRSSILASTSPARQRAIRRGFSWLDTDVPYSQSASHQGYRTDCSGFVSMCWELGSSPNTAAFMAGTGKATALASYDELLPGDAFIRSGHAAMFLGWEDAAHTSACIIELASTASDMQFRSRKASALRSSGAKAFRADYLANDLGRPAATTGETAPPPAPPPPPATNDDPPEDDPAPAPTPAPPETDETDETDETAPPPASAEESEQGEASEESEESEAYEVPLQPSQSDGDPGDELEPKSKKGRRRASLAPVASAGCTAAPGSVGTATGLPLLGALIAANAIGRRARRRPNA